MSTPDTPRSGAAQPKARGSDRRASGDGRLDPVRWHRPGRGTLLRLAAVAALLVTAATALWSHPQSCTGVAPQALAVPRAGISPPGSAPPSGAAGTRRPGGTQVNPAGAPPPGGTPGTPAGAPPPAVGAPLTPVGPGDPPAVPPGRVGVPVRLADPTALTLVRPGNHVDLLRLDDSASGTTVATSAQVLKVTGGGDDLATGGLLLALTQAEAERAVAPTGHGFAVLIRPD